MINRIENVLVDYLNRITNYAILLTGAWGSGKTHYIRNTFFKMVEKTPTVNSGTKKKYRPILISLFGVKSIDDIKDRIWVALFPLFDNTYVKTSGTLLKAIVKSVDVTKLISGQGLLDATTE